MTGEFRRTTRWGWQPRSRLGDGTAAVILGLVVAASFFGTILLLPSSGDGSGAALALAIDLPLIVIGAMVVAVKRSTHRSRNR